VTKESNVAITADIASQVTLLLQDIVSAIKGNTGDSAITLS
jgi:hypothetical protein